MSAVYVEADYDAVLRLAYLVEGFHRGDLPAGGLAAMAGLEDRLGLTPRARRSLQWHVLDAGELEQRVPAATASARPAPTSSGSSVRRLRAVDSQAVAS